MDNQSKLDAVIVRAKRRLRLMETNEHDADLRMLVIEGVRQFKGIRELMCVTKDIDCDRVEVPPSMEFFTLDDHRECLTFNTSTYQRLAKDNCSCSYAYNDWNGWTLSLNGRTLLLPSNLTATTINIYYWGIPTDDIDYLEIDENWERGLSAYAAYQFGLSYPNKYPQWAEWQNEWNAQYNAINGSKFMEKYRRAEDTIRDIVNSSVYIKYRKRYG